jgi:rhodanese-related sulfurtransferase
MLEIPELTVDEVAARIGTPNFHVFDCNGASRYKRGRVPTATHVNAYDFPVTALPSDVRATLVFYCSGPG